MLCPQDQSVGLEQLQREVPQEVVEHRFLERTQECHGNLPANFSVPIPKRINANDELDS